MLDELTSSQLSEWEAYNRLDPIGTWRDDFRMAFLAMTMTNLTIDVHGKKGAQHVSMEDFIPNWDATAPAEVKRQTVEEMKKVFKDIVQSQNKKMGIQPRKPPVKKQ